MHGIELKSGINNCHWNTKGKCTNDLKKIIHKGVVELNEN